jgi:hypothetical protein
MLLKHWNECYLLHCIDIILRSKVEGNVKKEKKRVDFKTFYGIELNVEKNNCEQKQSIKSLNTNKQMALN